ncbi:NAD-dependent epimerase/dehydratase family protein [Dactylosporangium sp. NPDC051541]|uniref:NAD-dependent epimerase/dehydratase family protein n=1 Tax=Dactylosporangium sp. NPDC051541 TaxID=3363977 RepID=UPI0037A48FC4
MSTVLVTGANGYLGSQLVTDLLLAGTTVRAVVRSPQAEADLRAAVVRAGADPTALSFTAATLTNPTSTNTTSTATMSTETTSTGTPFTLTNATSTDTTLTNATSTNHTLTETALTDSTSTDSTLANATSTDTALAGVALGGRESAFDGVTEVYHLASPMQVGGAEEIVAAARDSAVGVLRAARDAGVRRVVMTSSFAAIGYSPKAVRDYTEDDWTDPDTPGLAPYPRSKAVAERAAWDFIEREGGGLELVVINPTWIAGPTLTSQVRSSLQVIKALVEGTMPAMPRQRFGIADVRDVAQLHITAMRTPEAAGKRYLALADGPTVTWREVAELLGGTVEEAPGEEPSPLTIYNDRAKRELNFRPRPARTTLAETVESMRALGLL